MKKRATSFLLALLMALTLLGNGIPVYAEATGASSISTEETTDEITEDGASLANTALPAVPSAVPIPPGTAQRHKRSTQSRRHSPRSIVPCFRPLDGDKRPRTVCWLSVLPLLHRKLPYIHPGCTKSKSLSD